MEQNCLPIWEAIQKNRVKKRAWLHVPGHGGGAGLPAEPENVFTRYAQHDLTELPGLDDLFCPQGMISQAQGLAAELWHADETFFLVNGSSAGVLTMMLATCGPGDIVLAPRNAHGSFYHALNLCGAQPRYLPLAEHNGLPLNVTVDTVREGFANHPDARVLFLTSPSYYGVCADVAGIAAVVKEHGALLLLDEAHGAHLGFHAGFPSNFGILADLRVQSWHKTLGAITPGAVLHYHGERVDRMRLQFALQMTQTSSPSYPLLLSLDATRRQMALHGRQVMDGMLTRADALRQLLSREVPLLTEASIESYGFSLDTTRITMLTGEAGFCGQQAASLLAAAGIDIEFGQPEHLLAVVGPGFRHDDFAGLAQTVKAIFSQCSAPVRLPALPELEMDMVPRDAFFADVSYVEPSVAVGCVSAGLVVSYPPGVPLLAPGERITHDVAVYILNACATGICFRGLDDAGRIRIVKQEVGE